MSDVCKLIKQRIPIVRACQLLGLPITDNNLRCASPLHPGTNDTSFTVYPSTDSWYSWSDNVGGDVIELFRAVKFNGSRGSAIAYLADLAGIKTEYTSDELSSRTRALTGQIMRWHSQLTPAHRDYIRSRGITDDTIDAHAIGSAHVFSKDPDDYLRIIIPCIRRYGDTADVVYYVGRSDPARPSTTKYYKPPIQSFMDNSLFGLQTLDHHGDTLVIAEGAFDYLSFVQEGYEVVSGIGGTMPRDQLKELRAVASRYDRIILTYDYDVRSGAGQRFDEKVFDLLQPLGKRIDIIDIPREVVDSRTGELFPCKDVSDWYQHTRDLSALLSEHCVDGYLWRARRFGRNVQALVSWAERVSIKRPAYRIHELFDGLRADNLIPADTLKYIEKSCISAPRDDVVADIVKSDHRLLFTDEFGFFEYYSGYWHSLTDTTVQGMIGSALGSHNTNARAKSVLGVLKADPDVNHPDVHFNRSNCINFLNGTLDIIRFDPDETEPNDVRPPRPEDYLTYRLSYPYDRTAKYSAWQDFIWQVTNTDEFEIQSDTDFDAQILRDFAGYIIHPSTPIHRALFLIGSGRNGKSVFMTVLQKLFSGVDEQDFSTRIKFRNVTAISVPSLVQKFQSIGLVNSMLNVNNEIRSDVTGAEDMFKAIISGNPITDSFKGKDNVTFTTRAKFIVSLNNMIRTSDQSDGFYDRMLFVEFPLKFVSAPSKPNERLAIPGIENSFTTPESLSGIFNWAYRGYQLLLNRGDFWSSTRSRELTEEAKRSNDPVLDWALDFPPESIEDAKSDTYFRFTSYCESSNILRFPSYPSFSRSITSYIDKGVLPWKYERKRTKSEKKLLLFPPD